MESNKLIALQNELRAHWGESTCSDFETFRIELAAKIHHCLIYDMAKLMSFLYRIDVLEKDFKAIMNNQYNLDVNALQLADKIIERSVQKINYSNKSNWKEC